MPSRSRFWRHIHSTYYLANFVLPMVILYAAIGMLGLLTLMHVFIEFTIGGGLRHFGINPLILPAFGLAIFLVYRLIRFLRVNVVRFRRDRYTWVFSLLVSLGGALGIIMALRPYLTAE